MEGQRLSGGRPLLHRAQSLRSAVEPPRKAMHLFALQAGQEAIATARKRVSDNGPKDRLPQATLRTEHADHRQPGQLLDFGLAQPAKNKTSASIVAAGGFIWRAQRSDFVECHPSREQYSAVVAVARTCFTCLLGCSGSRSRVE